jgi:hypothetical protein
MRSLRLFLPTGTIPDFSEAPFLQHLNAPLVRTRIPVWTLENYRRLGWAEVAILENFPSLRAAGFGQCLGVCRRSCGRDGRGDQDEPGGMMASFYTNENFPIKAAQYLREMGHDVLTSHEAGKAINAFPMRKFLIFAAGKEFAGNRTGVEGRDLPAGRVYQF